MSGRGEFSLYKSAAEQLAGRFCQCHPRCLLAMLGFSALAGGVDQLMKLKRIKGKMNTLRPDSYCGLFCGACDILNCYRASLETGVPPAWEDLPPRFREHLHQAEMICQGCKTDVLFEGCKRCSIRICAREKKVEACNECADYPCQEVTRRMGYISETLKDLLPHTKVMFRNIDSIKEMGIAHWIKDQEQKWLCPQCGTPFTWYQETCSTCGLELEPVKDYNQY